MFKLGIFRFACRFALSEVLNGPFDGLSQVRCGSALPFPLVHTVAKRNLPKEILVWHVQVNRKAAVFESDLMDGQSVLSRHHSHVLTLPCGIHSIVSQRV